MVLRLPQLQRQAPGSGVTENLSLSGIRGSLTLVLTAEEERTTITLLTPLKRNLGKNYHVSEEEADEA